MEDQRFQWRGRSAAQRVAIRAFAYVKCGAKDVDAAVKSALQLKELDGSYRFCRNPELITAAQLGEVVKKLRGMLEESARYNAKQQRQWDRMYGRKTGS